MKGYFKNQEIYLFTVNQKNENPSYLFFYCKKLLKDLSKIFNEKNKHSFKFLLTLQPDKKSVPNFFNSKSKQLWKTR